VTTADRQFRETPIFRDLRATSFSYAFELGIEQRSGWMSSSWEPKERTSALRVRAVHDRLVAATRDDGPTASETFKRLIQPVRSFLDDVTTGPTGTNGRPMFFAASGAPFDAAERAVTIFRPERWHYEHEGEVTALAVPDAARRLEMRLVDSFCVFESGRIFYILTLTQPIAGGDALDEYAVLQLQQLSIEAGLRSGDAGYLGFDWQGEPGMPPRSLVGLAEARLASLEAEGAPRPNGMVDVLRALSLIGPAERRAAVRPDQLRSLCIGIEDELLLDTAKRAEHLFAQPAGLRRHRPGGAGLPLSG
jgi:hypothetical protein